MTHSRELVRISGAVRQAATALIALVPSLIDEMEKQDGAIAFQLEAATAPPTRFAKEHGVSKYEIHRSNRRLWRQSGEQVVSLMIRDHPDQARQYIGQHGLSVWPFFAKMNLELPENLELLCVHPEAAKLLAERHEAVMAELDDSRQEAKEARQRVAMLQDHAALAAGVLNDPAHAERLLSHLNPGRGMPASANLKRPLEDLDLSGRAFARLKYEGVRLIGDLVEKTEEDLLHIWSFGPTSLDQVKQNLAKLGLSLRRRASRQPA